MELAAKAKINLSLDVTGKRPDGYHEVRMIMQTVELHDTVTIEKADARISITSNTTAIPLDSRNIAYKAADLLCSRYKIESGVNIHIEKRIPIAAGLAGGSADAAAVLSGMNRMFSLGISDDELRNIGKEIGADVPFCIMQGTALSEGIGEQLTPLQPLPHMWMVLVKPPVSISTGWVYQNLILDEITERPDIDSLAAWIGQGEYERVFRNMKNVLENVTIKKYPFINNIKKRLLELGAIGSLMSGSGPTVFGIFADKSTAEKAYETLQGTRNNVFLTTT